jgi:thiamine-phosphate pyrophosphorylase
MNCSRESLRLYAVTDRAWLNGDALQNQVQRALQGGVTFVQLREKELPYEAFLEEAYAVKTVCRQYKVPFVINDNISVAVACDADGVHVGQSDMESGRVRSILGPDKLIGVSVQTTEQAVRAAENGADYLGVGAVFPTDTKRDASAVSLKVLREICCAVPIPVVAIGGITEENLSKLQGSGIAGVAVVSAIFAQQDIQAAAERLCGLSARYFAEAGR